MRNLSRLTDLSCAVMSLAAIITAPHAAHLEELTSKAGSTPQIFACAKLWSNERAEGVDVEDFGASVTSTGAANVLSIQAAVDCAAMHDKRVYLPHFYHVDAPIVFSGSKWSFLGQSKWSSGLILDRDRDGLVLDISNIQSNFGEIRNLGFIWGGSGTPQTASAIHVSRESKTPDNWVTNWTFSDLAFTGGYRGIRLDRPGYGLWAGQNQIAKYGHLRFLNIDTPYSSTPLYEVVSFEGGPGAHNTFTGGTWAATYADLSMGDGTDGIGDQLIEGIHMINAQYGLRIIGPHDLHRYRENFTIIGNQFDGIGVSTVYMERIKDFRLDENNSTSSVGFTLIDCQPYEITDHFAMKGDYGIPARQLTKPAGGSLSQEVFEIARSPLGVPIYKSVYVEAVVEGLINDTGLYDVLWRGFIQFSGMDGIAVQQIERVIGGPAAAHVAIAVVPNGTIGARAILTLSNMSQSSTYEGNIHVTGSNYTFKLLHNR